MTNHEIKCGICKKSLMNSEWTPKGRGVFHSDCWIENFSKAGVVRNVGDPTEHVKAMKREISATSRRAVAAGQTSHLDFFQRVTAERLLYNPK